MKLHSEKQIDIVVGNHNTLENTMAVKLLWSWKLLECSQKFQSNFLEMESDLHLAETQIGSCKPVHMTDRSLVKFIICNIKERGNSQL